MAKKVGIPRALFFYQYYPLWKKFFEELGAEVVISSPTNKKILDAGVKACVDEACLPVKLYHGHIIDLIGKVDYIFIPRLTSISKKEYICPKFGGLPDMIKHTIPGLPEIICTEINLRKSTHNALKAALEIGSYFSSNKALIKKAYENSLENYRLCRASIKAGKLPDYLTDKNLSSKIAQKSCNMNVAVIGHVYNVYDSYTNMDILSKLVKHDVNIITIDMLDSKLVNEKAATLPKKMFWFFGRKVIGSVMHLLERKDIDGIIYLMSFGCGIDAFMCDLAEKKIRHDSNIPFTVLTLDEHSGQAGMDTRLEAFIDMIKMKLNKSETAKAITNVAT